MSETIIIAVIGVVGAVLAGAIGAFATIEAAKVRAKSETGSTETGGTSCAIVGLVASVAAVIGLALGAMFAVVLLQQFSGSNQPGESPSTVSEPITAPSVVCSGTGSIPPTPEAPPNGCVLIVEWWVPPDPQPCGIIVTHNAVTLPDGAIGTWWFVYPNRPDSHLQEFAKRDLPCEVQDLR